MSAIVRSILPADEPPCQEADKVHRFLGDQLKLVPDVGALAGRAEVIATQLSGGLATWARRLQFQPFRLRVVGTAGSGKTQLALAAYQDTVNEGKRPLYVCFNRPLADHMSAIVPSAVAIVMDRVGSVVRTCPGRDAAPLGGAFLTRDRSRL